MPKSRLDEVKRGIREAMRAFTVGDPADPKTAVGPMVSQKQFERVQSYIRKGLEEGAEVLVGGAGRPDGFEAGHFVKPTVFVNVKNDMTIAQEEILAPCSASSHTTPRTKPSKSPTTPDTVCTLPSSGQTLPPGSPRGLLSCDRPRGDQRRDSDDPRKHQGVQASGVGREYGRYGIEAFLEPKAILE